VRVAKKRQKKDKRKKQKKIQKNKKRKLARWLADPTVEMVWIFLWWLPCSMYGMVMLVSGVSKKMPIAYNVNILLLLCMHKKTSTCMQD
jgi:hypothetical protein